MTKMINPARLRGVAVVRNDMSDPTKILNDMKKAFEEFKNERDKEVADLKKGMGDLVQSNKVESINAEITSLQASLDEVNRSIAALTIGGSGAPAPDAAVIKHAETFNSWFRKGERAIDADLRELEVNAALTTDKDDDGGYLVPDQMSQEIDRVVSTVSVIRELSTVMQISGNTYKKLINMGGTGSGWVGERAARPETDAPTLRELAFNLMELYANPAATQRTLDDARVDIATWLANEVAIEFAEQEGAAFVTGDGANKPRGILGYDKVTNGSYAWGKLGYVPSKVAAALNDTNNDGVEQMIQLYGALKQQYRNGASFVMSDATMMKIRSFKQADGTYLWAAPSGTTELPTILGKPVRTDDNMDAIGAGNFPIAFGNFKRGYLIVDGPGVRVLRDPYTNKPYVHFYTTKRTGGGVQNFEAIKLMKIGAS